VVALVLSVVFGYLLGTLPTAVLVGGRFGVDPRRTGSGNPGASNAYRTMGRVPAAIVLGGDLVKGAAAAGIGWGLGGHTVGLAAGVAAVVGHSFPLRRHGGKGVAACAGTLLVTFPLIATAGAFGWALVAGVARRPSVASLALAIGLPIGVAVAGAPGVEVALLGGAATIVIVRHTDNIRRLVHGTEAPIQVARP
jgi:glycerol-3-phosphate acyltransferase PlsY